MHSLNIVFLAASILSLLFAAAACSKSAAIVADGASTVVPTQTLQPTPTQLPVEQVPAVTQSTATVTINPTVIAATPRAEVNIIVQSPKGGDKAKSPIAIKGRARVYEATVHVVVKDSAGNQIGKVFATATAAGPEWGDFEIQVPIDKLDTEQRGMVEVFSYSPRDGSTMNLVIIPVTLLPA